MAAMRAACGLAYRSNSSAAWLRSLKTSTAVWLFSIVSSSGIQFVRLVCRRKLLTLQRRQECVRALVRRIDGQGPHDFALGPAAQPQTLIQLSQHHMK